MQERTLADLDPQRALALALASLEADPGQPMDVAAAAAQPGGQQRRNLTDPVARLWATFEQHVVRHAAHTLGHPQLHLTRPLVPARCAFGPDAANRLLWMARTFLQRPYYGGQAPPEVQQDLLQQFRTWAQQSSQAEQALRSATSASRPHQPPLAGLPFSGRLPAAAPFEQQPADCHVEHAASQPVAGAWPGGFHNGLALPRIGPMLRCAPPPAAW